MNKEIVGFTAGNFDLLHPGYIITFEEAKRHCDRLLVFIQIDPSAHRKSKYKPVIPLYDRYEALMSIKYIDELCGELHAGKIQKPLSIEDELRSKLKIYGKEFLLIKGMFEVLYPLLAK